MNPLTRVGWSVRDGVTPRVLCGFTVTQNTGAVMWKNGRSPYLLRSARSPGRSPGRSLAILASCVPLLHAEDAVVVGQFDSNHPRPVRSRIGELGGPGRVQSSRFACRSKVAPARRDPTGACSLPCLGLFFVPRTPSVSTVALPDACSPDGCPLLSGPAGLERGAGSRSTIERGSPPLDPASPLKGGHRTCGGR